MIARYTRPALIRAVVRPPPLRHLAAGRAGGLSRDGGGRQRPRRAPRRPCEAKAAGKLDPARILEHEERTRHDVIAFLTHVEELAGEPARWLHLGMTSSDVLDAALAITLVEAADQILAGVDLLRAACRRRAEEHRATPAIGRSHGIHAEPITAGLVFAGLLRRARAGARRRWSRRAPRSRSARSPARSAPTPTSSRRSRSKALAALGLRAGDRPDPDRGARSPRRLLRGAVAHRHRRRAAGAHRAPLAAHGGRRGDGGVRQRAEGLLGDAAQEEPDPLREPVRDRAPPAFVRLRRVGGRGALARARHLALVGRAGDRPRRHRPLRLHGPARRRPHRRPDRQRRADAARTWRCTGGLFFSEAVMLELVRKGMARQAGYELVQRNALRGRGGRGDLPRAARRRPRHRANA